MSVTVFNNLNVRVNMIQSAHLGGVHINNYLKSPYPVKIDQVESLEVDDIPKYVFVKSAEHGFVEKKAMDFSSKLMGPGKLGLGDFELLIAGRGILRRRD